MDGGRAQHPPIVTSRVIHRSADFLTTLIEHEKTRATASLHAELANLKSQLDDALRVNAANANAAANDTSRSDLERIKSVFGKVGIVFGDDHSVGVQGELAAILFDASPSSSPSFVDPTHILARLRQMQEENRAGVEYWRVKCQTLEKEKEELKEALENKIAGFMTQISSLQAEIDTIKSM